MAGGAESGFDRARLSGASRASVGGTAVKVRIPPKRTRFLGISSTNRGELIAEYSSAQCDRSLAPKCVGHLTIFAMQFQQRFLTSHWKGAVMKDVIPNLASRS